MRVKTLMKFQREMLVANHEHNRSSSPVDFEPVVKLFVCVGGNATWLLTEMDPETGIAFGLCDLGHGIPEVGYVSIPELQRELDWRLERDRYFTPTKTLSEYAAAARSVGHILA